METKKVRCAQFVWQGYHKQNCARTGLYEDDGKHYCKQHHPPSRIAEADARNAVWAAECLARNALRAKIEADQKEEKRRAACFDDLLATVEEVCRVLESGDPGITDTVWVCTGDPETLLDRCRGAIAKAKGGGK